MSGVKHSRLNRQPYPVAKSTILAALSLSLSACLSLPDMTLFQDDSPQNKVNESSQPLVLSASEQATRDKLLSGKTNRPTLKSLNLQPVSLEEREIPQLSLIDKRNEYEALLPLIKDPVQQQQIAFRLADIKMLIAEQNLQEAEQAPAQKQGSFEDAIEDYRQVLAKYQVIVPTPGVALTAEQQALNRKQMDVMYQLTRALDLSAQPQESAEVAIAFLDTFNIEQFDITPYHLELYFRIGEYHFNRQQYQQATQYYSQVIDYAQGSSLSQRQNINFYSISAYMLGWSHFKLDDYSLAMDAFAKMLDVSLSNIADIQQIKLDDMPVSRGELRLVKDAIRIMALTFSYQGNALAIEDFFTRYGQRDYEQLLYNELAQQHLDNDRFQDSADVLVAFARKYPLHQRAIEFYIRHIDAFVLGGFPERVLQAKADFVEAYSLGKGIVQNMNTPIGRAASPYLRAYIKQLAQTEHSIAQSIAALLRERQNNRQHNSQKDGAQNGFIAQALNEAQREIWRLADNDDLLALSQSAYTKAKHYYQNFIRTFEFNPEVSEVSELRFYLAEALFALGEYEASITSFETYAYQDSPNPKAVEAAYAALLGFESLESQGQSKAQSSIVQQASTMKFIQPLSNKELSQARFITSFENDSRVPMVALTLMQALFDQQNYIPAQEWAMWLLNRAGAQLATTQAELDLLSTQVQSANKPPQNSDLNITQTMQESAKLVIAHSHFAMDNFAQAELNYRQLLLELPEQDSRKQGLSDLLAASLYKQAETLFAENKLDTTSLQALGVRSVDELSEQQTYSLKQGLSLLQEVVLDTPQSEFRLAAQYDSAVYFLLLKQFDQAIKEFIDFKNRFPDHPLNTGIDEQLLFAYESIENWQAAAVILQAKHATSPQSELGRLALYKAAEYFEKAGDRSQSLVNFRRYAHQFPEPLAPANEARFILSNFYLESGEDQKRRFWLNKLVQAQLDINKSNTSASTPRSVYLASFASMVFATDADIAFTRIKLAQPLAASLKQKQSALQKAIYEYERVISFGSTEFVARANYKLAELYMTLASDLMDSDRPKDLSALELSQYELLLEEQAYPFEETAIDIHVSNINRVSNGLYDDWVKQSFVALAKLMPARYNKQEQQLEVSADDF